MARERYIKIPLSVLQRNQSLLASVLLELFAQPALPRRGRPPKKRGRGRPPKTA